jgi:hypothetical protein
VEVEGEKVRVSRTEDGALRFDMDGMERAFVLKSGRLYEREYAKAAAAPEEEREEAAKEEPEPEPTPEAPVDGPIVEQLGYRGEVEKVDTTVYRNKVVCKCGNVRWVKNADMFQVKKCKPCTLRERRQRRRKGSANTK